MGISTWKRYARSRDQAFEGKSKIPLREMNIDDARRVINQVTRARGALKFDSDISHVRKVGQRMAEVAGLPVDSFSFTVLNELNLRGFVKFQEKTISITYGLYRDCRSEDELAAVLGHEIGHIVSRLKYPQGRRQIKSPHDTDARKIDASHLDEYKADRLAIQFLKKAGYDPRALGRLLWRHLLYQIKYGVEDAFDDVNSHHPSPLKRIVAMNRATM